MPRPLWHYQKGISRTARDINKLISAGIGVPNIPYMRLINVQNELLVNLGVKIPRPMTLLLRLFGLSPGEIKLWHDAEAGWFTEARSAAGAPPVYHYVADEVAITLIKGELTHELEEVLMTPDDFEGN